MDTPTQETPRKKLANDENTSGHYFSTAAAR